MNSKPTATSQILNLLGKTLIGPASLLFGLPAGAMADLYLMPYDRPLLDPDDVQKPEWMRRRAFEIYIRRQLSLRVGMFASVAAMTIVIGGLVLLAIIGGAHDALHHFRGH